METLTNWLRGPLFWAALGWALLGLLRHVLVTVWEVRRIVRQAGDPRVAYRRVVQGTLTWLFPLAHLRNRPLFSATSVLFHAAVILVPLFLAGHVALWQDALGVSWRALPDALATTLTVLALITAAALVLQRLLARDARSLSTAQDYLVPLLVALPFATGLLLAHPGWSPLAHETAFFLHVLTADVVLFLTPLTKLSHMALLPLTQLVSETAWHFPPDAGARVEIALGKVGEPV
jgi:nitrate reductase gamma subunit